MSDTKATIQTRNLPTSTGGDIADWLSVVCKHGGQDLGGFRKTLGTLLDG